MFAFNLTRAHPTHRWGLNLEHGVITSTLPGTPGSCIVPPARVVRVGSRAVEPNEVMAEMGLYANATTMPLCVMSAHAQPYANAPGGADAAASAPYAASSSPTWGVPVATAAAVVQPMDSSPQFLYLSEPTPAKQVFGVVQMSVCYLLVVILSIVAVAVALVALPLLNYWQPELMARRVGGFTLTWLILGVLFFPFVWVISYVFIRRSIALEESEAKAARDGSDA